MTPVLRQEGSEVGRGRLGRMQGVGGQPREALDLALGRGQDLGPLAANMDRRQRDEASEEDREGAGHGMRNQRSARCKRGSRLRTGQTADRVESARAEREAEPASGMADLAPRRIDPSGARAPCESQ